MTLPAARDTSAQYILYVAALLVALITVARAPNLFIEPRFWAEEGSHFFSFAQRHSVTESILFIQHNSGGYFNLAATLGATIAANLVPLEHAPLATTLLATLFQMLPSMIILFAPLTLFSNNTERAIACLITSIISVLPSEAWLTTISSQVFCGITTALLLFLCYELLSKRLFISLMLFQALCMLSGPYATFLAPLFLVRSYRIGSSRAYIHASIVTLGALIQAYTFTSLRTQELISEKKFSEEIGLLDALSNAVYFHLITPILGFSSVDAIVGAERIHAFRYQPNAWDAVGVFVIIGSLLALALFRSRARDRGLLMSAFILTSVLTTLGAVSHMPGGRYAILPGTLLVLLLCHVAFKERLWSPRQGIASSLLCCALLAGVFEFNRKSSYWNCVGHCPAWKQEVHRWRVDPDYRPQVWPVRPDRPSWEWRVQLDRR